MILTALDWMFGETVGWFLGIASIFVLFIILRSIGETGANLRKSMITRRELCNLKVAIESHGNTVNAQWQDLYRSSGRRVVRISILWIIVLLLLTIVAGPFGFIIALVIATPAIMGFFGILFDIDVDELLGPPD